MRLFTITTTLTGKVYSVDPAASRFRITCRSGDQFDVLVDQETRFEVLTNLDGLRLDRTPDPRDVRGMAANHPPWNVLKYVHEEHLIVVEGIYYESKTLAAKIVHILYGAGEFPFFSDFENIRRSPPGELIELKDSLSRELLLPAPRPLFESPRWWIKQAASLADKWLDMLFGNKRGYAIEDFIGAYRTSLAINGMPTDNDVQECAVLSRLIYGLSAAFLMTGQERYLLAARAGIQFQRESFRISSGDGTQCMWAHARKQTGNRVEILVASVAGNDAGSIPIYEQIYALSGLAMYYLATQEPTALSDIERTMRMFDEVFMDREDPYLGYFSHVDYATMRPDRNQIRENDRKKNWNSIGDHIPAYLVNLILALDPLPEGAPKEMMDLLERSQKMLERLTLTILDKFPDKDSSIPFINERFLANWTPDHNYFWQQNRAVIGHNFKVAWNLTRIANYYRNQAEKARRGLADRKLLWSAEHLANRCVGMAEWLGKSMTELGVDQLRGGCFDTVERTPKEGVALEFPWGNNKDFWQQEQAILAHLILYGTTKDSFYLDAARETEAFWNVFFLDRDNSGIFFRVADSGRPILEGEYGLRGGHSDASGYHTFELAFLAHVYSHAYIRNEEPERPFCLYFRIHPESTLQSINILPDFIPTGIFEVSQVHVRNIERAIEPKALPQVRGSAPGDNIVVQLRRRENQEK